jgi:hypothetical protein
MPESFARGIHRKGGPDSFDPLEFWKFTYWLLLKSQRAMGNDEIARAYAAYLQSQGRTEPRGHRRKWERDRMLLLQMFALAGVKISSNQKGLKESLRTFWKDFSGEVLAGLNQWLQSGLAATLCRDRLPAEAVSYIRSARMQKGLWWPDHGMTLDTWCLTNSVVTEERLFQEWAASFAHGAEQHEFF